MYSRNTGYKRSEDDLRLPQNYDGVAFGNQNETDLPGEEETAEVGIFNSAPEQKDIFFPFLNQGFLGGLLDSLHIKPPRIGGEELLIIAAAIFLFISKDGDRECALFLAFLLFIN